MGIFIIILGLFLTGCGDRRIEDYERDRASSEVQKFQKASGVYSGVLSSKNSQDDLGNFSISLETDTEIVSRSGPSVVQQLSLRGQLRLERADLISVSFHGGFFNPSTGEVDANIPLKRSNDESVNLKLSGVVIGSEFKGTLSDSNFSDWGAEFNLQRNSSSPQAFPSVVKLKSTSLTQQTKWNLDKGGTSMLISVPNESPEEKLVSLLSPIQLLDVVIDYRKDVQISFLKSSLDQRTGLLRGKLEFNSSSFANGKITLDCQGAPHPDQIEQWDCLYSAYTTGFSDRWRFVKDVSAEVNP